MRRRLRSARSPGCRAQTRCGQIVDELEASELVVRVADPEDGRAKKLELTRRGREALAAARAIHTKLEKRLAAEIGARHVTSLRVALAAIVARAEREGVAVRLRPV